MNGTSRSILTASIFFKSTLLVVVVIIAAFVIEISHYSIVGKSGNWVEIYDPYIRQKYLDSLVDNGISAEEQGERVYFEPSKQAAAVHLSEEIVRFGPKPIAIPEIRLRNMFIDWLKESNIAYVEVEVANEKRIYLANEDHSSALNYLRSDLVDEFLESRMQ